MIVSREIYREIVEAVADGVVLLDHQAHYLYANPAAKPILGQDLAAASDRAAWDVLGEPIGTAIRQAYDRVVGGSRVQLLRNYFAHGRWYEVSASPSDEDVLISFRDITERLTAEATRRDVEKRFRLLVDGIQDYAIFSLDLEGHVTSWNTGAKGITGYRADEVVGQHFSSFYPPEDRDRASQELETAIARDRYEAEGWRLQRQVGP